MTETLEGSDRPLMEAFDAALLDLDGVAYRGPRGIPSAAPALREARKAGMTLVFVTNNASRTADDVADHLTRLGIDASPDEVLTSAQVAAAVLAERLDPGDRVLVVGGPALAAEIEARGLTVVGSAADRPAAVVQGWHPDVGWKLLAEASYAILQGADYLATNQDTTLPNDRGIAPGNGALVQAVITATGVAPDSFGKPHPRMFLEAAARIGSTRPLVVGDRLDTDIAGARSAGMESLLVLTGVHSAADAVQAKPGERPSFLGDTLAALAEPHPAPEDVDGGIRVRNATASIDGERIRLDGTDPLDRVRAKCAAAWRISDRGGSPVVEGA